MQSINHNYTKDKNNLNRALSDENDPATKNVDENSDEEVDKEKTMSNMFIGLVLLCTIIGLICLLQITLHLRNCIHFCILPSVCEKCWWETRYPN